MMKSRGGANSEKILSATRAELPIIAAISGLSERPHDSPVRDDLHFQTLCNLIHGGMKPWSPTLEWAATKVMQSLFEACFCLVQNIRSLYVEVIDEDV